MSAQHTREALRVGVLALQGDVREHLAVLAQTGAEPVAVRRPTELADVQALVIPGGESTAIVKLAGIFDLLEPIRQRLADGMPALGTCAGMILLADRLLDGTDDQGTFGGLDVVVRRNAFGRQVDSFEAEVGFRDLVEPVHAVFIRAPWVEQAGDGVDVLARVTTGPAAGRIVAVRQGRLMATSFHPEISGDPRIHRYFVEEIVGPAIGGEARPADAAHREGRPDLDEPGQIEQRVHSEDLEER